MIVVVDESLFTKRNHIGGRILLQQWIFGNVFREKDECFLVELPNRSTNTLLESIKENVEKETTLYPDSWKSYCTSKLEEESFDNFKVPLCRSGN